MWLILVIGIAFACIAEGKETMQWDERFTRRAFLVEEPTTLYEKEGFRPLQTLKPGNEPLSGLPFAGGYPANGRPERGCLLRHPGG